MLCYNVGSWNCPGAKLWYVYIGEEESAKFRGHDYLHADGTIDGKHYNKDGLYDVYFHTEDEAKALRDKYKPKSLARNLKPGQRFRCKGISSGICKVMDISYLKPCALQDEVAMVYAAEDNPTLLCWIRKGDIGLDETVELVD